MSNSDIKEHNDFDDHKSEDERKARKKEALFEAQKIMAEPLKNSGVKVSDFKFPLFGNNPPLQEFPNIHPAGHTIRKPIIQYGNNPPVNMDLVQTFYINQHASPNNTIHFCIGTGVNWHFTTQEECKKVYDALRKHYVTEFKVGE